jgi:hypothetical protein
MNLITGHDLIRPSASVAPLEFDLNPGDAELVATCASAIDALRQKNARESAESALVRDLESKS